jgi:uroporphyrinogen III methyltransferase/synthase
MDKGAVDVITFTSPSTLTNFMEIMGKDFTLPSDIKIACIGPVTAEAVAKVGLKTDIIGEPYTIPGLVEGLVKYFGKV